ncbi:hypothetical protein KUCAC02_026983 [Scomber scombrus]|uniref:Uncharacterized protein n=1 Tax=Scomber scombrus TaxID=13677 RepID=A0AAV1PI72_SCOSC
MEEDQLSQASDNMLADMQPTDLEHSHDANLEIILKQLREFRKDSSQKLNDIRDDINKIYTRVALCCHRVKYTSYECYFGLYNVKTQHNEAVYKMTLVTK